MSPTHARRAVRRATTSALTTAVAGALVVSLLALLGPLRPGAVRLDSASPNPVTPGNFYGYAYDACHTQSQALMNSWLANSPYLAVGVYISGNLRACKDQPNLNPAWVRTQLAKGWRLLPIDVGPQASCNTHFKQAASKIKPNPGKDGAYAPAGRQGSAEARSAVQAAQALGIVKGSALYYDLENFNAAKTGCRESALRFLSNWTLELHQLGYLSGVYSSGNSGVKALDQARRAGGRLYTMPDQLWIADWDGEPGTSSAYVSGDGWMPDARVKQYHGGHVEKWGRYRLDIDNDFVDTGKGTLAPAESHCGGVSLSLPSYPVFGAPGSTPAPSAAATKALKCLLQEQGFAKAAKINGTYNAATVTAMEAFQKAHHLKVTAHWSRSDWVAALSAGTHALVKYGSGSLDVYALQRSLNAADPKLGLPMTGIYASLTTAAVKAYQKKHKLAQTGNATPAVWAALAAGKQ